MDKEELEIYKRQIFMLFLIYIAFMTAIMFINPLSTSMVCDKNYACKVEMQHIWNIKRSANFYVNKNVKMQFYGGDYLRSGFVNIYNGGLNTDPFGTSDFITFNLENVDKKEEILNSYISKFNNYIKNPNVGFEMVKNYNRNISNIACGILTAFFMGLALTKQPLNNFLRIMAIFTRRGRRRW